MSESGHQQSFAGLDDEHGKRRHGHHRDRDEEGAPEPVGHGGEKTECRALVPYMGEVEKPRKDRDDIVHTDMFFDDVFRELVEDQDNTDDRADPGVLVFHLTFRIHERFPAHLLQIPGWSLTVPTLS
jgi:hypothetical protein